MRLIEQIVDARVRIARGLEYRFGLRFLVRLPDFFNVQNGEHHALSIAQRNRAASRLQRLGEVFGYVQRDRHRPQHTICQAHVVAHAFVIGARHESAQRREAAAHQQLQIANLPRG